MTSANDTPRTPARASVMGAELVWPCSACGTPIADGEGYLTVNVTDADERGGAALALRADLGLTNTPDADSPPQVVTLGDLLTIPDEVPWWALHDTCGPDAEDLQYWLAIERVRTPLAMIKWTAHLYGKRWFDDTTWMDILERVGTYAPRDQD